LDRYAEKGVEEFNVPNFLREFIQQDENYKYYNIEISKIWQELLKMSNSICSDFIITIEYTLTHKNINNKKYSDRIEKKIKIVVSIILGKFIIKLERMQNLFGMLVIKLIY